LALAGEALGDARRLVFVDESGFHTSMTRLRARAPRGKRAYGKVPRNRGKNQTLIASITLEEGMGEAISIKGATDAVLFETYVRRGVPRSDVEDRTGRRARWARGSQDRARVRELIERRGAELVFLPAYYSPDLNPIEEAFSKIKNIVRSAGARTREALDEVMGEALRAVTLEDVAGWFSHCGYELRDQYS
jgi:transposase